MNLILKFSAIQRRAVKWINGEQFASYSDDKYNELLRKHQFLPIKMKFIYNDLVMFYKIVNQLIPVELPDYITVCETENSRFTKLLGTLLQFITLVITLNFPAA